MTTTNKVDWNAEVAQAVLAMKEEGQKAYTYMKSEAPEIAREYVRWQIADAVGSIVMGVAFFTATTVAFRKVWKWAGTMNDSMDSNGTKVIGGVLAAFLILGSLKIITPAASTITKCIVAPRIVIIEGIKSIVQ